MARTPAEEGLRFATYAFGLDFAPTEDMLVTYEVRGTGTCRCFVLTVIWTASAAT